MKAGSEEVKPEVETTVVPSPEAEKKTRAKKVKNTKKRTKVKKAVKNAGVEKAKR